MLHGTVQAYLCEGENPDMENNKQFTLNEKFGNILILKGFMLSFVFLAIYFLAYFFFGKLVQGAGSNTGNFIDVWGPPFLIAFIASLLCCLFFLILKQKEQVPVAFTFLTILYIIVIVYINATEAEEYRAVETAFINLYCLPCLICGNLLGWGLFFLLNKRNKAKEKNE